ncbi:MAG: LysR substrate-binding domain-containing protein [Kiloniellaceae bacterium]
MARHLDSELLRTFAAIADHGSFSRAGTAVGRSQSAVSLQMKRLEDTAGCSLFRRQSHGVSLTASGENLLQNARRILRLMERAAGELNGEAVAGTVRLGMPTSYSTSILSAVLKRFAEACPDVEVTVSCAQGLPLQAALAAGELDLIVFTADNAGADAEPLVHDPAVWVTSVAHDTHLCDPLPVALFESGCWWRDRAMQILEERGRRYRIACTSPNTEAVIAAVVSGLAVAVLELSTVPEGARILTESEGFPGFPGSTVMLRRRPGATTRAVDRMEAVIRNVFCRK